MQSSLASLSSGISPTIASTELTTHTDLLVVLAAPVVYVLDGVVLVATPGFDARTLSDCVLEAIRVSAFASWTRLSDPSARPQADSPIATTQANIDPPAALMDEARLA